MGGAVVVQLQGPREGIEHLRRGMLVTTLLEADVVVHADAGQVRDLLAQVGLIRLPLSSNSLPISMAPLSENFVWRSTTLCLS